MPDSVARRTVARRTVALVALAGAVIGAVVSIAFVAAQPSPCCGDLKPFVSILPTPLSRIDATLAEGDGHAFAAIAEDPLMRRPEVFQDPRDFAYREQRPVWGYLAWAGSLGQPAAVGLGAGRAHRALVRVGDGVTALLLLDRPRSAWWAMLVPVVGFETLTELTPELFAYALARVRGLVLGAWPPRRRGRLSLGGRAHPRDDADRRCWPSRCGRCGTPPGRHARSGAAACARSWGWRSRSSSTPRGSWSSGSASATGRSTARTTGSGSRRADWLAGAPPRRRCRRDRVLGGHRLALVVGALLVARGDLLTWIATAFLGLGAVLGPDVWLTIAGYQRTLVPLYLFAAVAVLGGLGGLGETRCPARSPVTAPER